MTVCNVCFVGALPGRPGRGPGALRLAFHRGRVHAPARLRAAVAAGVPGAVVSACELLVGLWAVFLAAVLCHALFATPL